MNYAVTPGAMRAMEQEAFDMGVSPLLLMEQAARAVFLKLSSLLQAPEGKKVLFLCGGGNNGGDGLAVARMFLEAGGIPTVLLLSEPGTEEGEVNLAFFEALDGEVLRPQNDELPELLPGRYDAVVDALFGTGLSRGPEGKYKEAVDLLNRLRAPIVIAVDIPSGMDGMTGAVYDDEIDAPLDEGAPCAGCVKATHTVTLGYAKQGLYLTQHKDHVGEVTVAPLCLPAVCRPSVLDGQDCAAVAGREDLASLLPKRGADANKATCGRVLLYAGSNGMAGAAAMAAMAALRAGAGLVTILSDSELIPILQTLVPNAMCVDVDLLETLPRHDVLAAGCGIGRTEEAYERLTRLLSMTNAPVVLDADALYLLSKRPFELPKNAVLTPHIGEAARLLQIDQTVVLNDMANAAQALQARFGGVVVLKSSSSVIFDGKLTAINISGSSALAKGGSGDALCGILASLLCRQQPFYAAQGACLWLGLASEKAGRLKGVRSALTTDILDLLGTL